MYPRACTRFVVVHKVLVKRLLNMGSSLSTGVAVHGGKRQAPSETVLPTCTGLRKAQHVAQNHIWSPAVQLLRGLLFALGAPSEGCKRGSCKASDSAGSGDADGECARTRFSGLKSRPPG